MGSSGLLGRVLLLGGSVVYLPDSVRVPDPETGTAASGLGVAGRVEFEADLWSLGGSRGGRGGLGRPATLVSPFAILAPLPSLTSPSSTSVVGFLAPAGGLNSGADALREECDGTVGDLRSSLASADWSRSAVMVLRISRRVLTRPGRNAWTMIHFGFRLCSSE